MKRHFWILLTSLCAGSVCAAEGGAALQAAHNDLQDVASLQRGARMFINYCVSCHSARYMRYNRMAADLNLTDDQLKGNLIFTSAKPGDTMQVAMRGEDAKAWFGVAPPDLSVIARARGTDWLFSFLTGFYADPSRPTGVNNAVFASTAMPHVLWELQGIQQAVIHTETAEDGTVHREITGFELVTPGKLSDIEYRRTVRDLVNFLEYVGEPAKLQRTRIGAWVMLYLSVLLVAVWLLKREVWRDVH